MIALPTAEQNIYSRLASAPTFHPASADLFADDWTLEAGDVVTVKSGNKSYNVPVYSMNLEWHGDSRVTVQSTGNQKRTPLPALSRKEYTANNNSYRSGYGNRKKLEEIEGTELWQNRNEIALFAGKFTVNGNNIKLVDGAYLRVYKNGVESVVGTVTEINTAKNGLQAQIDEITGTALYQNRNHITLIAGKFTVSGQRVRLVDGASFQVSKNGVFSTVGTVSEINTAKNNLQGQIDEITGTGLYQNRTHINLLAGKFTLSGTKVKLVDGAELQVSKNGTFSTVGTVTEINSAKSEITGSTLWQNRNSITAAVGCMEVVNGKLHIVSGSGLLIDESGGSFGVYTSNSLTAGIIVNKINGGSVTIQASKVDLGNYATVGTIETTVGAYFNGSTTAQYLRATSLSAATNFYFKGKTVKTKSVTIGNDNLDVLVAYSDD